MGLHPILYAHGTQLGFSIRLAAGTKPTGHYAFENPLAVNKYTWPTVECPVDGCTYNTGDVQPVVAAALITAHALNHKAPAEPVLVAWVEKVKRPSVSSAGSTEDWLYFGATTSLRPGSRGQTVLSSSLSAAMSNSGMTRLEGASPR